MYVQPALYPFAFTRPHRLTLTDLREGSPSRRRPKVLASHAKTIAHDRKCRGSNTT